MDQFQTQGFIYQILILTIKLQINRTYKIIYKIINIYITLKIKVIVKQKIFKNNKIKNK